MDFSREAFCSTMDGKLSKVDFQVQNSRSKGKFQPLNSFRWTLRMGDVSVSVTLSAWSLIPQYVLDFDCVFQMRESSKDYTNFPPLSLQMAYARPRSSSAN